VEETEKTKETEKKADDNIIDVEREKKHGEIT